MISMVLFHFVFRVSAVAIWHRDRLNLKSAFAHSHSLLLVLTHFSWLNIQISNFFLLLTGRSFAATTTEGLLVYSLDSNLVFEPFDLSEDITPKTIRSTLKSKDYSRALLMALKLNEMKLTREVYETIPPESVVVVVNTIASAYVGRVLNFIVSQIDTTPHIEFHLKWIEAIFYEHGTLLQKRTPSTVSVLRAVQKSVGRRFEDLSKLCQFNRYTLQYILSLSGVAQKRSVEALGDPDSSDDNSISEEEATEMSV